MTTSHSSSESEEKLPKDVSDETSISTKHNPGANPHVSNIRNFYGKLYIDSMIKQINR